MLGIQEAGVDFGRGLVTHAHHEDLGGGVSGGCRLGGLHLVEQQLEGVQQGCVVLRPAELGMNLGAKSNTAQQAG